MGSPFLHHRLRGCTVRERERGGEGEGKNKKERERCVLGQMSRVTSSYNAVCVCVCAHRTQCMYVYTLYYMHTSTYMLCSIYNTCVYTRTSLLMSFSRRAFNGSPAEPTMPKKKTYKKEFNGSIAEPCMPRQAFSKVSTCKVSTSVHFKSLARCIQGPYPRILLYNITI